MESGTSLIGLSLVPIDLGCRVARYPVEEEGGETPLEQDGAPGHQVRDRLSLLLPSVPSKSAPQLPYLLCCHWMPTAQRFCHHWDKSNPLSLALLSCAFLS